MSLRLFRPQAGKKQTIDCAQFLVWLSVEPQSIVWLPTLHRLAASEAGELNIDTFKLRLNDITTSNHPFPLLPAPPTNPGPFDPKIKDESARNFWRVNFLSLKSSGGVVLSFTWLVKDCVRGVLIHYHLCLLIETLLRKHHLLPSSQDSGRVLPGKEVKTSSAACHVMLLWLLIGNKLLFYFSEAQSKMQHLQRISHCRIQVCGSFKPISISAPQ